ncbi:MAG: aminotransferase class III-fold pyridoxal phosphate-dependent enzyme [Planctomycetes bacterium]|nr:aminotransferase class III-fold pyridoxal phosphate-dependent enzyme [Planctomycetota bacterium]
MKRASQLTFNPSAPVLVTELPGPKAQAWVARDRQRLSPSYTRDYPLVAASGSGCTIEDVDGNRFLDFTAGIAVTSTGHCHPEVVGAIAQQAERLIHMSGTDFYYAPEIELAERLAGLAPAGCEWRVFFTNSGAETNEAALKLARWHTGRQRIIAFNGAFHGRTCGALSISGSKAVHSRGFGPLLAGVHRLPFDCTRAELNQLLATSAPAEEVAAIFVEPMQGEGGYRPASPEFLPMLREVCDQHGIMLVVDEVQSGMGRTGRWFAFQHWNIVPDMISSAKGIASGLPLGALIAKAEIMDWPPGAHASTFGGNPVSCAASLKTIELIEHEFLTAAAVRGAQLRAALEGLAAEFSCIVRPRGLGLMQAVDVVGPQGDDRVRRDAIIQATFRRGLLMLGCGSVGLRFCPALCVTAEQINTAMQILREAIREVL